MKLCPKKSKEQQKPRRNNTFQLMIQNEIFLSKQYFQSMDSFLLKIKQKSTFERQLIDQYNKQLTEVLKNDEIDKYVPLGQFFEQFVKNLNEQYNTKLIVENFELFDQVVTPLILSNLRLVSTKFQQKYDEYSAFTNEQFENACKSRQNLTQEELNVKPFLVLKDSFMSKAYDKSITSLRKIPMQTHFTEMRKCLIEAIKQIYLDIAEVTDYVVTGDDLADIMVYVILKAKPANFVSTLYAIQNNLPMKMLEGETGYYLMAVNMAITIICTMTDDYIKKDQLVKDSQILSSCQFVLPHPQLYVNQIDTFFEKVKQIQVKNYRAYYCLEYIYDEKQFFKTINVKQEGETCDVIVVKFKDSISCSQANVINNQLSGFKNVIFHTEQIDSGKIICVKDSSMIQNLNQQLILFQSPNPISMQEIDQIYRLSMFSCFKYNYLKDIFAGHQLKMQVNKDIASMTFVDDILVEATTDSLLLIYENQIKALEVFKSQFRVTFDAKLLFGLVRLIYQLFGANPEPLPEESLDTGVFDYFCDDKVLPLVQKVKSTGQIIQLLKFLPSTFVQKFLFSFLDEVTLNQIFGFKDNDLQNFINALQSQTIPFFEQMPQIDFIAPLSLKVILNLLRFLLLAFGKVTDTRVDSLSGSGFTKFITNVKNFQQENNLVVNGYLDVLTVEKIIELLVIDFCKIKCKPISGKPDIKFCLG